ncbi:Crp/Fnr family transcriptional regulator [Roseivivax sp. CAU 1761]
MTEPELAFMERFKAGEITVEPGTPLLEAGSNSPQLYTALRGFGLRYCLLEDGRRQVLSFVLPGDTVGLQAGVMQQMNHHVEATTAMTLCVFNRRELWTLFESSPRRGYDLTWIASAEESFLAEALTAVGQQTALESIAWALSRMWRRLEALDERKGRRVPFPYRQQDLADALGLSLVHTNKTLKKLRDRQLATWSEGWLTVPDIEELEAIGQIDVVQQKRPLL